MPIPGDVAWVDETEFFLIFNSLNSSKLCKLYIFFFKRLKFVTVAFDNAYGFGGRTLIFFRIEGYLFS